MSNNNEGYVGYSDYKKSHFNDEGNNRHMNHMIVIRVITEIPTMINLKIGSTLMKIV